jgi:hypothetical protein
MSIEVWRRAACAAAVAAFACGQSPRSAPPDAQVSITLQPTSVTIQHGAVQQFSAAVTQVADASVVWSVVEGAAGGTIDARGLYTAPETSGTFHVTATSRADPSKSVTALVTVLGDSRPAQSIGVVPEEVHLVTGSVARFIAMVTQATDSSVTWSVLEGASGGSIDASGLYTAPAAAGTYHVIAQANADPTRTAMATAIVAVPPPGVSISISPDRAQITTSGKVSFTATVVGTIDTGAMWSVAEGAAGGSVDGNGLYAPPPTAGTYHVIATAHGDPSKSATAEVAVIAASPPRQDQVVTISPQSLLIQTGGAATFFASAPGSGLVDFTVLEGAAGGSMNGGFYTSSSDPGTYHVVAASRDDPRLTATATVIVRNPAGTMIPSSITVAPAGTVQFTSSRPPDELLTWDIKEGDAGGTISDGFYQAPTTAGTYHVQAHVSFNRGINSLTAEVTVRPDPVYVTVNIPHVTRANPGWGATYRATVHGSSDQRVTWSIVEGAAGGTIDADGQYSTPRDHTGVFHIVATSVAFPSASATATFETCMGDGCGYRFRDAGGAILPFSVLYALFWGDPGAFPADLKTGIESMLRGLDGSAYLAVADQYMRGAKATTRFAGSLEDRTTPPASFLVDTEVCRILDANGVAPRSDGQYFLYASNSMNWTVTVCAWHTNATCHGVPIQIAYMPNPRLSASGGCDANDDLRCSAGGSQTTRNWQNFTAHELMETITDAHPSEQTAWVAPWIDEIGDACAGRLSCVPLGAETYQLQSEYSNAAGGCATH